MKKYSKVVRAVGIVVALSGIFAAGVNAQGNRLLQRQKLAQRAQMRPGLGLAGLNLSQAQKDQVKAILASHKEQLKAVARESASARKELAAALANDADPDALKTAYDKVSAAGWNRLQLKVTTMSEIKGILTPEQLQKIERRKQIRQNAVKKLIK